jgi:elongation factor Ts
MDALSKVRELRNRTNVGLAECKSALEEAGGDVDRAIEVLQKRGSLRAQARSGRIAAEGRVHSYVHTGGNLAVLVEVNCETSFAAKSDPFIKFCESVAMQIAAMAPRWVSMADVPQEELDRQRHVFLSQLPGMTDEKVTDILTNRASQEYVKVANILNGKAKKWFSEVCLMEQASVEDPKKTVEDLWTALVASIGENVTVRRFARWEVGEGVEKPKGKSYVEEVGELLEAK